MSWKIKMVSLLLKNGGCVIYTCERKYTFYQHVSEYMAKNGMPNNGVIVLNWR